MMEVASSDPPRILYAQLRWLVRLRWVAGLAVTLGACLDHFWLHWWTHDPAMIVIGVAIVAYNGVLWWMLHRPVGRRPPIALMVWGQILPDLIALTAITAWTGGVSSPLMGFFVFHVVFFSLLQPPRMAYTGTLAAIALLLAGLPVVGAWPADRREWLIVAGWCVTLLLTVYLANRITTSVRRHRYRLLVRNHRVRALARRIQQQQQTMIQHEKTVAMGRMAAGVAHEIANPLASMDSLLQLMQRNPTRLTPQSVTTLRQQVDRIKLTVQQMTEFAHPTELYWQTLPLDRVVDQAMQMIRFDRRHRQVKLTRVGDDACVTRVQPHALQQALINLLLNAMDAMASVAEPALSVTSKVQGDRCVIEITDNGHGIKPEHLDRLFEPFFTTKPVGKGTGLGLAITDTLIRNQGGKIEVTSQVGLGTTMRILLPLTASPDPSSTPVSTAS
jgi:signal transduction histidine kinase